MQTYALGVEVEFLVYFQSMFLKGSDIKKFYKKTKNEKRLSNDILDTLNDEHSYLVPWRLSSDKVTEIIKFVKKYAKDNPVYSSETSGLSKDAYDDLIFLADGIEVDWNEVGRYGELITRRPFGRSIGSVIAELKRKHRVFMTLVNGALEEGDRAYIPEEGGANFIAYKNMKNPRDVIVETSSGEPFNIENSVDYISSDYNGSIHANWTLPYGKNETKETVMVRNYYMMKLLQWFEPLFVSTVGQPDPFSPVLGTGFTEGSFRMASNRWSGMGTQNLDIGCDDIKGILERVSKMDKRIPERAFRGVINSLKEDERLRRGYPVPTPAIKEYDTEENRGPSQGADFRRGDLDLKESNFEKKYFGFEFRTLDFLKPEVLLEVLRVMALIGDHSEKLYEAKYCVPNPLKNPIWNTMTKAIMNDGYNATITASQRKSFYSSLKIGIPATSVTGNMYASDMFQEIVKYLYSNYREDGAWSKVFSRDVDGKPYGRKPNVPNVNKKVFETYIEFFDIDPISGEVRGNLKILDDRFLSVNLGKTLKYSIASSKIKTALKSTSNEARDYFEYLRSNGMLALAGAEVQVKKSYKLGKTKESPAPSLVKGVN